MVTPLELVRRTTLRTAAGDNSKIVANGREGELVANVMQEEGANLHLIFS